MVLKLNFFKAAVIKIDFLKSWQTTLVFTFEGVFYCKKMQNTKLQYSVLELLQCYFSQSFSGKNEWLLLKESSIDCIDLLSGL